MSYNNSKYLTVDWPKYFSYDDGDTKKKEFFSQTHPNSALNRNDSIFKGETAWDVFICAMAIGKKNNTPKKIKKGSNTIPVAHAKQEHIVSMLGVIFSDKNNDLEILNEPKKIRTICEEYANGGVEDLMEWMDNADSDNPLSELKKEFERMISK